MQAAQKAKKAMDCGRVYAVAAKENKSLNLESNYFFRIATVYSFDLKMSAWLRVFDIWRIKVIYVNIADHRYYYYY